MSEIRPRIYKRGEAKTQLSDGEVNCLRLVLKGYSSKKIAVQLNVSSHTVDARLKTSMAYFQTDSRMEAAKRLSALDGSISEEGLVYQIRPRLVHQTQDIATIECPKPGVGDANRGKEGQSYVANVLERVEQVSDSNASYATYPKGEMVADQSIGTDRGKWWQNHNTYTTKERVLAILAIAGLAILAFGFFVNSVGTMSRLLAS